MLHVACMQGNWVDSGLLVVSSQITNLTPGFSFGHNVCFRCPNGRCEPILDIYASITFQWYKKIFNAMGFDPYNRALKIQKSIWDSNSQHGSSFGSVKVHSLTLFAISGACDVIPRFFFWLTTLQPLVLVTSPRLRLRHVGWRRHYWQSMWFFHRYSWHLTLFCARILVPKKKIG
jgi:hypothetical protein